jgi:tetratricopeptide (TPR) repeat protein
LLYEEALSLDSSGNRAQAEQKYREAIAERKGKYPEAWHKLTYKLASRLLFQEAAFAIQNYIKQTSENDHRQDLKIAQELKQAANLKRLIEKTRKPSLDGFLHYAEFIISFGENRFADAEPYAQKAMLLYPDSVKPVLLMAEIIANSHPPQRERELLLIKKALEMSPHNAQAHVLLGNYYLQVENGIAVEEFKKALELSEGRLINSWYGLGQAYRFMGKNSDSIEAYSNYLKSDKLTSQQRRHVENVIKTIKNLSQ